MELNLGLTTKIKLLAPSSDTHSMADFLTPRRNTQNEQTEPAIEGSAIFEGKKSAAFYYIGNLGSLNVHKINTRHKGCKRKLKYNVNNYKAKQVS